MQYVVGLIFVLLGGFGLLLGVHAVPMLLRAARIGRDGILARCEIGLQETRTVTQQLPGPRHPTVPAPTRKVTHAFVQLWFTTQDGRRIGFRVDLGRAPATPRPGGYQVRYLADDPHEHRLADHRLRGEAVTVAAVLLAGMVAIALGVAMMLTTHMIG